MVRDLDFTYWADLRMSLASVLSEQNLHHGEVVFVFCMIQHLRHIHSPNRGLSRENAQEQPFACN